ncbi:MAG: uroporphyrinogen-III C-methyltransferase, partial [Paludibacteraceae bacterium]|nr:uroporphyrinogen-III C-methyltransferase [Paludibacteraceae bacterium]
HVVLAGFGPGDPELLTVKAVKALRQADIIFYDDLIGKQYLDTLTAEKIYVGKRNGLHHTEQDSINRLLLDAARKGKEVVRLKGGDPMIFAHGGEEIEFLQSNLVDVKVIPGITTASALAASTKVSLTHRDISSGVSFVNGHAAYPIVPNTETIVYYMGGKSIGRIGQSLHAEGWPTATPVLLVHNVSLPDEQTFETTVGQLAEGNATDYPTPVIALVGDVARLRRQTASTVRRTLYTGLSCPEPDYIHTPLIEIRPVEFELPDTNGFDYLLFTSRHAVRCWFQKGKAAVAAQVVSIGPATTEELKLFGVTDVFQTEKDDSYGVLDYFCRQPSGRKVLFPRSDLGLDIIPDGLCKMGFQVTVVTVYQNVLPQKVRRVNLQNIQRVVFTSPSTINNFVRIYGGLPKHIEYVTRGAVTKQYLMKVLKSHREK